MPRGVIAKLARVWEANNTRATLFADEILPSIPDGESVYVYAPTLLRARDMLALIPDDARLGEVRARSMHQSVFKYRGDAPDNIVFLDYNEFTKTFWYQFAYPLLQVGGRKVHLVKNGSVPSKPWFEPFKPPFPDDWEHHVV